MKKILSLVAFLAICGSAEASYLYWQVNSSDYQNITEPDAVNAAILWAKKGDNSEQIDTGMLSGSTITPAKSPLDVTSFATGGYSFYVELVNWNASTKTYASLGLGDTMTYSDLQEKDFILNEALPVSQAKVWTGLAQGGSYVAPEPTSGLLMLFGLAGLALKRRKA